MQKPLNILIASDSFKGSLTSSQVNEAICRGVSSVLSDAQIQCIPMSDGGEGLLQCFTSNKSWHSVSCTVFNPLMQPISATYLHNNGVALIEMAEASGLTLIPPSHRDALRATSYGFGQLIHHAITQTKASQLLLFLGGSATTDAGLGAMQALGVKLLNSNGEVLPPGIGGGELHHINSIDSSSLTVLLHGVHTTVAVDVSNPMFGPNGAAHIFAPQKGATPQQVSLLDNNLRHIANLWQRQPYIQDFNINGSGAAGAAAASFLVYMRASLQSGINIVMEQTKFTQMLEQSDLLITGEGKIDEQSFMGKLLGGVIVEAQLRDVPVLAIGGRVEKCMFDKKHIGVEYLQVSPPSLDLTTAMQTDVAANNIQNAVSNWIRGKK